MTRHTKYLVLYNEDDGYTDTICTYRQSSII